MSALLDPCVTAALLHVPNGLRGSIVERRKQRAWPVIGTDRSHLILGELPGATACVHGPSRLTALRHHVGRVLRRCAEEQVCRVHAQPHVAAVADGQPLRDRPVVQFIGEPMSHHCWLATDDDAGDAEDVTT